MDPVTDGQKISGKWIVRFVLVIGSVVDVKTITLTDGGGYAWRIHGADQLGSIYTGPMNYRVALNEAARFAGIPDSMVAEATVMHLEDS